ncbi:MAG: glutathione S-transferase family protein [Chromatiales bacterium]|nr:glutathione S-transferase family protein [Chromatiales bacterium]
MSILYGIPLSTFTRKIRFALAEKGVDYELRPVRMGGSAELRQLHPLGKVPVYQSGDLVIPDSSVIIAWLERVHLQHPLYPADPALFAQALFLEEYADTRLREGIAPIFYECTLKRMFQKKPPDDAVVARAMKIVEEGSDYVESCVAEGPFILGNGISVADVAVAAQYITLEQGGTGIDAGRWPRLAAWLGRFRQRPRIAAILEEEADLLAEGRLG